MRYNFYVNITDMALYYRIKILFSGMVTMILNYHDGDDETRKMEDIFDAGKHQIPP